MFWQDEMRQHQREEAERQWHNYLREERKRALIEKLKREPKRYNVIRDRWGKVR